MMKMMKVADDDEQMWRGGEEIYVVTLLMFLR